MNKEFITYEQALALRELGFKEACFMCWYINKPTELYIGGDEKNGEGVAAPLYQQAFRWFREKGQLTKSIMDFIDDETGVEWDYEINLIGTDIDEKGNYIPLIPYSTDDIERKFKTYEEAELNCLKKLIEIVNAAAIKSNNQQ